MSVIRIYSENFSGDTAYVTFNPATGGTIEIGFVPLPYDYETDYYYGQYTLFFESDNKTCYLNIPTPTPTPTPTPPAPTPTPTPTPTPQLYAYLFIEPITGATDIGQWMYDNGSNFFGFTNDTAPTQDQTQFEIDMNLYVNFSGWTSGLFHPIITQNVPQMSGGLDAYGNPIIEYNFLTTEISEGTIPCNAWYTWIIPVSLTNNQKQVTIDLNYDGDPNALIPVNTESTIYRYTFTYTGTTIEPTTYRVYTTFPNRLFALNNTESIYFRGNSVSF